MAKFQKSAHPLALFQRYDRPLMEERVQARERDAAVNGRLPALADWILAAAYCSTIGVRLPTPTEWEKSARGPDSLLYP